MQRADGGANITMKHTGINYGYDRPKELSEAQRLEQGRVQMAASQGQDHEAKYRADVLTRLGRIEAKLERLLEKTNATG
jgi:phosphoglycerate-specific signal transduction histidine kinase